MCDLTFCKDSYVGWTGGINMLTPAYKKNVYTSTLYNILNIKYCEVALFCVFLRKLSMRAIPRGHKFWPKLVLI